MGPSPRSFPCAGCDVIAPLDARAPAHILFSRAYGQVDGKPWAHVTLGWSRGLVMLQVECESCRAPYQIDERRVPPAGLKMRCPKCGHSFTVRAAGSVAPAAAPSPPQASARALPSDFPAALGSLDEPDLPVVSAELPAAKAPPLPPRPAPRAASAPVGASGAGGLGGLRRVEPGSARGRSRSAASSDEARYGQAAAGLARVGRRRPCRRACRGSGPAGHPRGADRLAVRRRVAADPRRRPAHAGGVRRPSRPGGAAAIDRGVL